MRKKMLYVLALMLMSGCGSESSEEGVKENNADIQKTEEVVFEGEPFVDDVQHSGCLTRSGGDSEEKSARTLTLTREDSVIYGKLYNYYLNCAASLKGWEVAVETVARDGVVYITLDDGTGPDRNGVFRDGKDCNCPLNLSFTLHGIASDEFPLVLDGEDLGVVTLKDGDTFQTEVHQPYGEDWTRKWPH